MAYKAGNGPSPTQRLLAAMLYVRSDTFQEVADVLNTLATEAGTLLGEASDKTLARKFEKYKQGSAFMLGDASKSGRWQEAIMALQRYAKANPGMQVGQMIVHLTMLYRNTGWPRNLELVQLVDQQLDDKNPHK
ncbi:MAG: hypothetical protein PVI21_06485 [Candidatus Woesebacteria bacterium]|jgi:hypothetical protein